MLNELSHSGAPIFLKKVYLFKGWGRKRERDTAQVHMQRQERSRDRGRHRIPSRLCAVSAEPDVGLELSQNVRS